MQRKDNTFLSIYRQVFYFNTCVQKLRSFDEQPDVSQPLYSNEVTVSWSEAYLKLVKCVDYFYVQTALVTENNE
jgi:hypothetical protein